MQREFLQNHDREFGRRCLDCVQSLEGGLDLIVKHPAFRGCNQAIADPSEKREADRSLELHNASADGWLRYAKHFRCSRRGATSHHSGECLDLAKIHLFPVLVGPPNASYGGIEPSSYRSYMCRMEISAFGSEATICRGPRHAAVARPIPRVPSLAIFGPVIAALLLRHARAAIKPAATPRRDRRPALRSNSTRRGGATEWRNVYP
jgi:hypothetical protein